VVCVCVCVCVCAGIRKECTHAIVQFVLNSLCANEKATQIVESLW